MHDLTHIHFDRYAIAQQLLDSLVVAINFEIMVVGLAVQGVQGPADLRRGVTDFFQEWRAQAVINIDIASAVGSVAQIVVAQFIAEQGDNPDLRHAFGLPLSLIGQLHPADPECSRLYAHHRWPPWRGSGFRCPTQTGHGR